MRSRGAKYSSMAGALGGQRNGSSGVLLWRWELMGMAISVASTIAIITVLWYMDSKALARWNVGIGLNTTVQAFSAVAQTSMMLAIAEGISQLKWTFFQRRAQRLSDFQTFDEASRGPWGALVFLYKIRWHAVLASIAALITILALAMSTFTQQAIGLPTHLVRLHNETASVKMARNLDTNQPLLLVDFPINSSSEVSELRGEQEQSDPTVYDVGINEAIYTGLFAPQLTASHMCSSGDCTWTFETLGICSTCNDVSNETEANCTTGLSVPTEAGSSPLPRSQICRYTTPSGFKADAWACISANTSTLMNSSLSTHTWPWKPLFSAAFFRFAEQASVPPYNGVGVNASHCQLAPPSVHECELTWCLKTYSSSFKGGNYHDQLVSTVPLVFNTQNNTMYRPNGLAPCSPTGPEGLGISFCVQAGLSAENTIFRVPGFKAQDFPESMPDTEPLPNADKAYWINTADAYDIVNNLHKVLSAELDTQLQSPADQFLSARLWKLVGANASLTMENMATSLTNAIRDGPNATTVYGASFQNETYVHVKWPWLVLPVGLVLASAAFLATCIFISHADQTVVWKSSLLPILFHGLRGWSEQELQAKTLRQMEEVAKETDAHLEERNGNQLQLWKG